MRIQNKSASSFMLFYMLLMNAVCLWLAISFCYQNLCVNHTPQELTVLLPLALGPMLFLDAILLSSGALTKCFLRFETDEKGIFCRSLFKSWRLDWADIKVYGLIGHSPLVRVESVFFSTDGSERPGKPPAGQVSKRRIAIQTNEQVLEELYRHMPETMKGHLETAIRQKQDCYHRVG